uniref:SFRICE_022974 n=1 Tax=Spodoptera frugiperda TaxID=7108 RepID=A0A2H1W711_SPOFR
MALPRLNTLPGGKRAHGSPKQSPSPDTRNTRIVTSALPAFWGLLRNWGLGILGREVIGASGNLAHTTKHNASVVSRRIKEVGDEVPLTSYPHRVFSVIRRIIIRSILGGNNCRYL